MSNSQLSCSVIDALSELEPTDRSLGHRFVYFMDGDWLVVVCQSVLRARFLGAARLAIAGSKEGELHIKRSDLWDWTVVLQSESELHRHPSLLGPGGLFGLFLTLRSLIEGLGETNCIRRYGSLLARHTDDDGAAPKAKPFFSRIESGIFSEAALVKLLPNFLGPIVVLGLETGQPLPHRSYPLLGHGLESFPIHVYLSSTLQPYLAHNEQEIALSEPPPQRARIGYPVQLDNGEIVGEMTYRQGYLCLFMFTQVECQSSARAKAIRKATAQAIERYWRFLNGLPDSTGENWRPSYGTIFDIPKLLAYLNEQRLGESPRDVCCLENIKAIKELGLW